MCAVAFPTVCKGRSGTSFAALRQHRTASNSTHRSSIAAERRALSERSFKLRAHAERRRMAAHVRPSSRASTSTRSRPSSALSIQPPATPLGASSKQFGGLSEKQVHEINASIARVKRQPSIDKGKQPASRAASGPALPVVEEGSFIANSSSFAAAPLNSRVPPASPRRDAATRKQRGKRPAEPAHAAHAARDLEVSPDLRAVPTEVQEALLIEDLLSVMMVSLHLMHGKASAS